MPPYFFTAGRKDAERIVAGSQEGTARVYGAVEAQGWMRGAMGDNDGSGPGTTSRDLLTDIVVKTVLAGDALMHVDAVSREALQALAQTAGVEIQPFN